MTLNINHSLTHSLTHLILLFYKRGLQRTRSVTLSKHITHYGPRSGFWYYNLTTPIVRVLHIWHLETRWVAYRVPVEVKSNILYPHYVTVLHQIKNNIFYVFLRFGWSTRCRTWWWRTRNEKWNGRRKIKVGCFCFKLCDLHLPTPFLCTLNIHSFVSMNQEKLMFMYIITCTN